MYLVEERELSNKISFGKDRGMLETFRDKTRARIKSLADSIIRRVKGE